MRHLEEGEIHAWLDGALAPDEAARIETHVAGCGRCAEEVATARGLIAGASRILLALDSVAGGVIPSRQPTSGAESLGASDRQSSAVHDADRKQPGRRQIPWFSRPITRIAAGLVLAAGIGTVAARQDGDEATKVTVEFREAVSDSGMQVPSLTPDVAGPGGAEPARTERAAAQSGNEVARGAMRAELPPAMPAAADRVAASAPALGAVSAGDPKALSDRVIPGSRVQVQEGGARGLVGDAASRQAAESVRRPPAASGIQGKLTTPAAPALPTPATPAPRVDAPPPAREEARAETGRIGGGAGGGLPSATVAAGRATATDSGAVARMQRADSARLGQGTLRLSNVVVTGVTDPTAGTRMPFTVRTDSLAPRAGFAATRASLAGACFDLSIEAQGAIPRGEMPLPPGMRIRLADLQNIAADAARTGAPDPLVRLEERLRRTEARGATPPPAQAQAARVEREPIETVEWEATAADSILARRLTGIDVIVLRLAVAGDQVTGTAVAQTATTPPTRVTGRRIACDGF